MTHPERGDKPHKPGGTRSPGDKQRRIDQLDGREKRAYWRFRTIKYVYDNDLEDLPRTHIHELVEEAVDQGELHIHKVPSYGSINRWMNKAEELDYPPVELGDWFDDKRPGRPPKEFDDRLEEFIVQELKVNANLSDAKLRRMVARKADKLEVEAPTYDWIKRFRERLDQQGLAAWKHGQRAAVADATPKLTVPADRPHEVWTLDEKQAPVWIRAYHPNKRKYVAVKPQVILVVDNYSRAIVSYRVVPPFRTGAQVSFNEEDVFGTILSAAFKELAPSATRQYAGFLPDTLRWDRHKAHRKLSDRLNDFGVEVPQVPGSQPWSQGRVERLIKTIKTMCENIEGWDEKWVPASQVNTAPSDKRSKAAASKHRETTKMPIATRNLMNCRQFREAFDERVKEYNSREHSVLGAEPEIYYHSGLEEDRTRSGRDALYLLPNKQLNVSKKGITYRQQRFAWESGGRQLRVGMKVDAKPDPLLRGVFVRMPNDEAWEFLPRLEDYARKVDHKKLTIDAQRRAKEAHEAAEQAREQLLEERVGPEGIAEAELEMEASIEGEEYAPNREPLPEDRPHISPDGEEEGADEDRNAEGQPDAARSGDVDEQQETDDEDERYPPGMRSPGDRIRRAE